MFTTLIFDFDYTLVDSSDGVVECAKWALKKMDIAIPQSRTISKTVGLSLYDTFTFLTTLTDSEMRSRFSSLFLERADQVMVDRTVVFEGVADTIKCLFDRGITLGIVSTKVRYRIVEILDREALTNYFSVILGAENVAVPKPDPEGIIKALANLDVSKSDCVYVGDSITDAEAAKRANVEFVAVLSGVTNRSKFAIFKPMCIINNVNELFSILDRK